MKPKFNRDYGGMQCRVCLVREGEQLSVKISQPKDVYELVKDELTSADREMLLSIMLTTSNHLIGVETVSIGTLSSTTTSPREVFKSAILSNACGIILCHNHPSGELCPSGCDYLITDEMTKAGDLLGIRVVDHVVVSHMGYRSIKECKIDDDQYPKPLKTLQ